MICKYQRQRRRKYFTFAQMRAFPGLYRHGAAYFLSVEGAIIHFNITPKFKADIAYDWITWVTYKFRRTLITKRLREKINRIPADLIQAAKEYQAGWKDKKS